MKFKPGDKVCRTLPNGKFNTGDIITVEEYENDSFFSIKEDLDGPTHHEDYCELVLVENQTQKLANPNNVGTKNDQGKPRISLIPKAAILGAARGLTYGEKKYGTHNFRNGLSFSRLADATMRHLTSWLEGENNDPESSLSHLDHAIASLAMLKFMEEHRADMDDRWLDPMYDNEKPKLSEPDIKTYAEEIQKRGR